MTWTNAIFVFILSVASVNSFAAPLFPNDPAKAPPLEATLSVDLDQVMKEDAGEVAGQLSITTNGKTQTFNVKVSPRGKSRQQRCKFFPLWINFKKSEVKDTIFAEQNKLKLVTHCSNNLSSKGYVPAEMLVYRLFNLFTETSFRVRAVNMTYVDGKRSSRHPAFFIEHKKALAKRLGGQIADQSNPKISELDPSMSARVTLFQYMIGNTDFSLVQGPSREECCHNAVPLEVDNQIRSVPYDFDVTGFVNVPYAGPVPSLGIKKLTQRLYRGYCKHNAELETEIEFFKSQKETVFAMVNSFGDLEGLRTKRHIRFLEGFYNVVESERSANSRIYKKCR